MTTLAIAVRPHASRDRRLFREACPVCVGAVTVCVVCNGTGAVRRLDPERAAVVTLRRRLGVI